MTETGLPGGPHGDSAGVIGIDNSYVAWFNTFQPVPRGRADAARGEPGPTAGRCDFENSVREGLANNLSLARARFVAATGELERDAALIKSDRNRESERIKTLRGTDSRDADWLIEFGQALWIAGVLSCGLAALYARLLALNGTEGWLAAMLGIVCGTLLGAWAYLFGHRIRVSRSVGARVFWAAIAIAGVALAVVPLIDPAGHSGVPLASLTLAGAVCITGLAYLAHDPDPAFEHAYRRLAKLERLLTDRETRLLRVREETYALASRMPRFAREMVYVYRTANRRARKDGQIPPVFQVDPVFPDVEAKDFGIEPAQSGKGRA